MSRDHIAASVTFSVWRGHILQVTLTSVDMEAAEGSSLRVYTTFPRNLDARVRRLQIHTLLL